MNRRVDFVIPECYVDTNLVETLVCTKDAIIRKAVIKLLK